MYPFNYDYQTPSPVHFLEVGANATIDATPAIPFVESQEGTSNSNDTNNNGDRQWKMLLETATQCLKQEQPYFEEESEAEDKDEEDHQQTRPAPIFVQPGTARHGRVTNPIHVVGQTGRGITISPISDRCDQHPSCKSVTEAMRDDIHAYVEGLSYERIVNFVTSLIIPLRYKGRKNTGGAEANKLYARNYTNEYHLCWGNEDVIVCRAFFVSTVGITQWTIRNWLGENPNYKGKENRARINKINKKPKQAQTMQKTLKKVVKNGVDLKKEFIDQPQEQSVVKHKAKWLQRFQQESSN